MRSPLATRRLPTRPPPSEFLETQALMASRGFSLGWLFLFCSWGEGCAAGAAEKQHFAVVLR